MLLSYERQGEAFSDQLNKNAIATPVIACETVQTLLLFGTRTREHERGNMNVGTWTREHERGNMNGRILFSLPQGLVWLLRQFCKHLFFPLLFALPILIIIIIITIIIIIDAFIKMVLFGPSVRVSQPFSN